VAGLFCKNNNMRNPIFRSYLTELTLPNAAYAVGQQINFPDIAQLKDVVIFGAQAVDTQLIAASPSGRVPLNTLNYCATLYKSDTNNQAIQQYPAGGFNPFYNSGLYLEIVPFKIDLTKSFVTLVVANSGGTDSVLINFFYLFTKEFAQLKSARPRLTK